VAVFDGCEETIASASVTVRNVPPAVSVVQIADGDPFILTNLAVNFVGAFTDPGADTHVATVAWTGGEPPSTTIARPLRRSSIVVSSRCLRRTR
jgi:hypothetical protein